MKGKIAIVSGPSGVGKSTLCRAVAQRLNDCFLSVSMTTRPPGGGEAEGNDYLFVGRPQFEKEIRQGNLLEYAEIYGNLYGTPKPPVDRALEAGKTVLLEIDVQGGLQVMRHYPGALSIFVLPPDAEELVRRITQRGREERRELGRRLSESHREIADGLREYRFTVINDEFETAVERIMSILSSRRGEKE